MHDARPAIAIYPGVCGMTLPASDGTPAAGARPSLDEVYGRAFGPLHAAARALTGRDEAFCLDVVQDVFVSYIRRSPAWEGEAAMWSWLRTTLVRAAIDRIRRDERARRRESRRPPRAPGTGESDPWASEWLREAVALLPERDRALLGLRYAHGRTLQESGLAEGIGWASAQGRLTRALRRLRESATEWMS